MTDQLACLDGEILPAAEAAIPANDEGLLRGDGVFEVMRVYGGRPFALEAHLERLARSGANLRLPVDVDDVRRDIDRLLAAAGEAPGREVLRVVLTRGGRRLLLTEGLPAHAAAIRLGSISYAPTRVLDGVKSLSYGANMLASRIARERGFDEALLVSPHGRVLEGSTSSVFWVTGEEVFTPPLEEHILASITRQVVIEVSGARERVCSLQAFLAADEAFLCSTLREVQPIAEVDGRAFPGGPATPRIAAAFSEHVRAELSLV